ncbi:hypothetical protein AMTR_s00128p00107240 [Amborella trichopoda]|uniref:Uncharacterized protein n=1 Tax=Amborella trichopoda TaxID=13333 RepID=W1NMU8_AMBTC|nr:hypothetical protein AMTR_s00128p00107240 [Amborella trichopoda]
MIIIAKAIGVLVIVDLAMLIRFCHVIATPVALQPMENGVMQPVENGVELAMHAQQQIEDGIPQPMESGVLQPMGNGVGEHAQQQQQ